MFGAPDVTHWKEICKKDKQNKKELVAAYKDFCKERVSNNVKWTLASLVPLIIPNTIRNALYEASGKIPVTVHNAVAQTKEYMLHRLPCLDKNHLIVGLRRVNYKQIAPIAVILFAVRQTYLLGRNSYRNHLATQKNLSYLDNDVLEKLGNPKVDDGYIYRNSVDISEKKYARILGMYVPYRTLSRDWWPNHRYKIYTIHQIKRALSGKHPE